MRGGANGIKERVMLRYEMLRYVMLCYEITVTISGKGY